VTLVLRRATADDWTSLRRIRLAALTEAPWAFGSTLEREQGFTEETWRSRAEAHPVYLVLDGERAVATATGFVDPEQEPDAVQVVAMYVAPEARRRGCARLLLDAVVDGAAASGARRVLLRVTTANRHAEDVYRRYGFEETGRREPLAHSPGVDQVEMALPLVR
jgi:ribosomal protein S18 acetylase RimI-like enzyme